MLHALGDIFAVYKSVVLRLWWARGPCGRLLENNLVGPTTRVSDAVDLDGGQETASLTKKPGGSDATVMRSTVGESVFCTLLRKTRLRVGVALLTSPQGRKLLVSGRALSSKDPHQWSGNSESPPNSMRIIWWNLLEMQFLRLRLRPTKPAPAFQQDPQVT